MFATRNKCIAPSSKCLTSSNKKLLGAPGIATRNKDLRAKKNVKQRFGAASSGQADAFVASIPNGEALASRRAN